MHSVDSAIVALQTLIGRPSALFDAYATVAALEEVVHTAQKANDERATRYSVILRRCRPLVTNPVLQSVLISLVASKAEAEVAKAIEKAIKDQTPPAPAEVPAGRTRAAPYNYRGRGRGDGRSRNPRNVKCWVCGLDGHFARSCSRRH